jgi:hypothetical protein
MLAAAAEAGLGDQTKIYGVFDIGTWIHSQFEDQFHPYQHTACADICHATEYLSQAGRELCGPDQGGAFGMAGKRRLLDGDVAGVLADLQGHRCNGTCITDERGGCVVRAAARYLQNHRQYLNYPPLLEQGLPVGSGEAESGIRHLIKKRLDVAARGIAVSEAKCAPASAAEHAAQR